MINVEGLAGDRLYLDTNVIIYFVEGHLKYRPLLELLFEAIDGNALGAVTSELSLAEVLVKPLIERNSDVVQVYTGLLSSGSHLSVASIDRATLVRSAELRAQLGCRAFDAIHLATAGLADCDYFLTEDMRIRTPEGLRLLHLSELLAPE